MNTRKFSIVCALLILLFGVNMAFADITASNLIRTMWGNKRVHIFDVAFDSSYNYGGEDLKDTSGASLFLSSVDTAIIYGADGYTFKYDAANETVKAYTNAPPIIYEEQHIATGGTSGITAFQLDYPAAFIVSLVDTGGTNYPIVYSGITNHSPDVATLSAPIQDGVRTGVSVVNGTYVVTYATQAWSDLYGLLVQNELMTGTGVTRHTISGNSIFAFAWAKQDGALSGVTPIDYADVAATGEMGVDIFNSGTSTSGVTQATVLVATSAVQYYITYLKQPARNSWLEDRLIYDEDATSGTSTVMLDRALLLWLTSGYAVNYDSASLQIVLQDQPVFFIGNSQGGYTDVSGVSEIRPHWGFRGGGTAETSGITAFPTTLAQEYTAEQVWSLHETSVTIEHAAYLYGHPWEVPNLKQLEVPNGTDLSKLTGVKVLLIGR